MYLLYIYIYMYLLYIYIHVYVIYIYTLFVVDEYREYMMNFVGDLTTIGGICQISVIATMTDGESWRSLTRSQCEKLNAINH